MTFLYEGSARFLSHFSPISLLTEKVLSLSQTPQTQPFQLPHSFFGLFLAFFFWYDVFSLFIIHFMHFLPNFWGCWTFLGFSKLMSLSQIFGIDICLNDLKSSCITSHEHFNYIFMHYRCMLYTLNCCVLLDLDWAKPMIFLNLHVTCSCIFMHTYLQLFIFLYIILLVLFWLSLNLSCVSLLYGT